MPRLAAILLALVTATPVVAGPRDELLRVAPADAALVVVVQNARDHAADLAASPFADWFPSTPLGKKLLGSPELKQLRDFGAAVLPALGTTPQAVLDDVIGDCVAFAYSPAPAGRPDEERAVILIRPRKPELLAKIIGNLNDIQTKNDELKAVTRLAHNGEEYFTRVKPDGSADFYCFRGAVFAFSSSETDVKAVIDRDKAPANNGDPVLVARMKQLGVADAAAVILVNPRPLDAELTAHVAAAKPEEKRILERFAEVWRGLESAAVFVSLDKDLELGVALRFHPEKLPADLKKWFVGPREWGTPAALIPKDALFGFAGHVRASELIDLVASATPVPPGKPGVKEFIGQTLGPIIGRDNLPLVLDSLGPNWAVWAEPPAKDAVLPALVAAVEIGGDAEARAKAEKALTQAATFAFQTIRVAYNARHTDQIELREEKDEATGATVRSLVNDKGFPAGFSPSFAVVRGHLVLATTPDAIRKFRPSAADGAPKPGHVTLGRLSGTACRDYLRDHGEKLARWLAELGVGDEKALRGHLDQLGGVLELLDSAELQLRDIDRGLMLSLRVTPTKPLKK